MSCFSFSWENKQETGDSPKKQDIAFFAMYQDTKTRHKFSVCHYSGEGKQGSLSTALVLRVARPLQKFNAWADLVHEVVRTEFPDFEVLAAFSVFWLDESMEGTAKRAPHTAGPSDWSVSCLQRLANIFDVREDTLKTQFQDHQRIAQTVRNQNHEMTAASA